MSIEFSKYLAKITKGFFSDEKIDKLINLFDKEWTRLYFDNEAESNLFRIINSLFDKVFFLDECMKYQIFMETICTIAAKSNFLTDVIVRNPELIYLAVDQSFLKTKITRSGISKDFFSVYHNFKSINSRINFLKLLQRKLILKIGLNDILYSKPIIKVTVDLSILANSICELVFNECVATIAQKYGIKKFPRKYSLCSLGKLGGNELNYSSDIDLVIFYDENNLPKKIKNDYQLMLSEIIRLFIKTLSELTDKGFLYRVDFRLRPDGNYSPLCQDLQRMINYYDTRGEEWERQMLIKLNFISGDKKIFKKFFSFTQKYIYESHLSQSPLKTIKLMKDKIEKFHEISGNVKTAPGGIRDIEFIVQALQILNGKHFIKIRISNSLKAIKLLEEHNLLTKEESKVLKSAYIFYRKIEHFLQLMNNRQTHTIPDDIDAKKKLSNHLGFVDVNSFEQTIEYYRHLVKTIFNSITGDEAGDSNILFEKFSNPQKAKADFEFLSTGTGTSKIKTFDRFTISKFDGIRNALENYLKSCYLPDRTLDNFVKLTRSNNLVSNWYSFLSNDKLINDVLKVCEFSQLSINNISYSNSISDTSAVSNFFVNIRKDLYSFECNEIKSILAAQYVLGFINEGDISKIYTEYIRQELQNIFENIFHPDEICLIALGSFAVREMNFFSDVDLIPIINDFSKANLIESQLHKFIKMANEKIKGTKIDFRLRPEGKNSILTIDLNSYIKYYSERARVWEYQSLLKSDFVFGNFELYQVFKKKVFELQKLITPQRLFTESSEMFNKLVSSFDKDKNLGFDIKKSSGGFLTIDFLLSYLFLSENLDYKNHNIKFVDRIDELISIAPKYSQLNSLKKSYAFFKKLLISLQIFLDKKISRIPKNDEIEVFYKWMGFEYPENFEISLDANIKIAKQFFANFLKPNY